MITAEFIESNTENWANAKRIAVNKKSIAGSPDICIGIKYGIELRYLLELHTFEESVCFKSIRIIDDNVVFGYGEYVHFFNIGKERLKSLKLDGYFGHLYLAHDLEYERKDIGILVASAGYLHRFTPMGDEVWKSTCLGIDGIIVLRIEYPNIVASGEWDPPGGWVNVKIDLETGANAI